MASRRFEIARVLCLDLAFFPFVKVPTSSHTARVHCQAVMDAVFENRTVSILLKYRPLENSRSIFPLFPVLLQEIDYRYFVSVFLGIPQHRITVYDGTSIGIVSVF